MARPKKQTPQADSVLSEMLPAAVPAAKAPPEPKEAPKMLYYFPVGTTTDKWMVEQFDLLAVEVGLNGETTWKTVPTWEKEMALFHGAASEYPRGWLIVRRLFGVRPVIPPADAHPDDLETHSRERVCAMLGLSKEQLQAELDAVRAKWGRELKEEEVPETRLETPQSQKGELTYDEDILKEFGFPERMFELRQIEPQTKTEVDRPAEENRAERGWFAMRVGQWKKMLQEPMASGLTREALLNELYLRRVGTEMSVVSPTNSRFDALRKAKKELEEGFQSQLEQLQVMFPELNIAGKISFKAQISDVFKAYREYYANKNTKLIDRVRTAGEIEVELRQSLQAPEARYRFSLNVAIVEAMHGLYDPNFRSQFRPSTLKKLDEGFRAAVERVRKEDEEALVDLEDGIMPGEGSEYADIPEVEIA